MHLHATLAFLILKYTFGARFGGQDNGAKAEIEFEDETQKTSASA